MKKALIFSLICLLSIALAISAFGFGPSPQAADGTRLQESLPTKTTCVTVTKGRATAVQVPITAMKMNWSADDGTGTAVKMKRSFDTEAGFMPSSGEYNLPSAANRKKAVFTRYTGASNINLCYEQ